MDKKLIDDAVNWLILKEAERYQPRPCVNGDHPDAKLHASILSLRRMAREGAPPLVGLLADALKIDAAAGMRASIDENIAKRAAYEAEIASATTPDARTKWAQQQIANCARTIGGFTDRLQSLEAVWR